MNDGHAAPTPSSNPDFESDRATPTPSYEYNDPAHPHILREPINHINRVLEQAERNCREGTLISDQLESEDDEQRRERATFEAPLDETDPEYDSNDYQPHGKDLGLTDNHTMLKIAVIGATGAVGREIVKLANKLD